MSTPARVWFQISFPKDLDPDAVAGLLRNLHGWSARGTARTFVFETVATSDGIEHWMGAPAQVERALLAYAASTLPGLHLKPSPSPQLPTVRAGRRLWLSTSRRPLEQADPVAVSSALLSALSSVGRGQVIVLQWILGPVRRPLVVGTSHGPVVSERWALAIPTAAVLGPRDLDAEARRALRDKQGQPGWRAVGRVGVVAATPATAHRLLGVLLGSLRTAEGPGARVGYRPINPNVLTSRRLPWRWGLALAVPEVVGLIAWPYGELHGIAVSRRRSPLLPVPRGTATTGRVLALSPLSEQPIAIALRDLTAHLWAVGPTGVGKSTLLLHAIVADMTAGRSVVVIEPKQDLIADVLDRVPEHRRDDVVVLDHAETPVGFNPLKTSTPELTADQILTVFARLNSDSWGPRLAETLHAGLLTLARTPGMSLSALPLLLTNEGFRRRVVGRLDDPLGVSPIWAAFDRLSDEGRAQVVSAILNKVRPMVSRSQMRGILGQAEPRFQLSDILYGRKIVLVDLAKGVIGPDSARLLGTLFLNSLWQTLLTRSQIPPERRHTVCVYVDELSDYVGLPADLGEILSQARGLGASFAVACQHASQLPPALLAGVMSNARSKVVFQTDSADGALLARGQKLLMPEDFTTLPSREVYLRVAREAEVSPWMSGRTLPPPPVTSDGAALRRTSQQRYGIARSRTDEALRRLVEGPASGGAIGGVRRPS